MRYDLPHAVRLRGKEFRINADFRAALDIFEVLNDPELSQQERLTLALGFFYPEVEKIPEDCLEQAVAECFRFLSGGQEEKEENKGPVLMSWEQDFPLIIAPINRVVGREIREEPFFHWWSFLGAYMEIGECLFARVVSIREKRRSGRKLDKADEEFYRKNREMVELPQRLTTDEKELLKHWGGIHAEKSEF